MTYNIHRYKLRYIMFPILDDETDELIHWDVHRCDCSGRAMKNNWCRCDAEEPDTTFVYTIEEARQWANEDLKYRRMTRALGRKFHS